MVVCVCVLGWVTVQCALLCWAIDHNPRKLCIWMTVHCFMLTYFPVMFVHSRTCVQNTIPY